MRYLAGLVCALALSAQVPTAVVPNRAPLSPNAFYPLPLGSVKPAGWLKQQLRIQANGLTGHLDEVWPDVGPNSAWLGGNGEGWERGPYYLDGLLPLAYLLGDPALIAKARKWVDWTLDHQRPDGGFGPETTFGKPTSDWWPNMVMLKVLTQYQEASGDPRVIPVLEKYFAYQAAQLESNPLHEWAQYRWGDEVLSIIWLYNRNGDPKLLDLARTLAKQGFDWKALFADYPYKDKVEKKDATLQTHGVNNAMALKTEALWSLISGDPADRESSRQMLEALDRYHGAPTGTFAADEHVAGHDPSQGTELCAVVEEMFSLEELTAIYGDPISPTGWSELPSTRCPAHSVRICGRTSTISSPIRCWSPMRRAAGPPTVPDRIFSALNQISAAARPTCIRAGRNLPRVCGWVRRTKAWRRSPTPRPRFSTTVGSTPVHIAVETDFPFDEMVTIKVDPAEAATFPITLRVPGWTANPTIRINGASQRDVKPGSFFTVSREWRPGDVILMKLTMPIVVSHGYRGAVFVSRGPLLYSLNIGEKWKKLGGTGPAADWEVDPTTPWNFGLVVKPEAPQSSFSVQIGKMTDQPFSPEGTPVSLHAKGIQLRSWKLVDNSAGPLPESPVKASGVSENITLIPYGAAKLRITEFPEIQDTRR